MRAAIERAAVLGGGTMGLGIAQILALAGWEVALASSSPPRTRAALEALTGRTRRHVEMGLWTSEALERLEHVRGAEGLAEAVDGADVLFEAVPEDLELKLAVLEEVSRSASQEAIITTNTSSLPIERLAEAVQVPERFVGVHWFNPPEWIPGVEVIPSTRTGREVLQKTFDFLRVLGKQPVQVGDGPGFVANRLQYALFTEALRCVTEGIATPEQVDAAVRNSFGFRLPFFGPFQIADMAGLDIYAAVYDVLEVGLGARFARPEFLSRLVAEGRLGTKKQRGFYDYQGVDIQEMATRRDRLYAKLDQLLRESDWG
ncbi:MAG: 3-hydroxyacyl-CoA dehydrogenase family protein [Acidimicrobiia bacterium]